MSAHNQIAASLIPTESMLSFLPRHFGVGRMMTFEDSIYDTMGELASSYRGGAWAFHELSNGGCYLAPTRGPWSIEVQGNYFHEVMSADAAGIAVCLTALSRLAHRDPHDVYVRHFHLLRDYALEHPDWPLIARAID